MRSSLLLLLIFSSGICSAQADTLMTVFGVAKNAITGERIKNLSVMAVDLSDTTQMIRARGFEDGRYDLALTEIRSYLILYSAPGYVTKSVQVDMAGPTEDDWKGGFGLQIDATLLEHRDGVDYSALKEPFGRSSYVASAGNFEWDREYSDRMRQEQEKILKIHNKK